MFVRCSQFLFHNAPKFHGISVYFFLGFQSISKTKQQNQRYIKCPENILDATSTVYYDMISRVWFIYFLLFYLKLPYCIMIVLCIATTPFFIFYFLSFCVHHIHTQNGRDDDGGDYTFCFIYCIESEQLSKGAKISN